AVVARAVAGLRDVAYARGRSADGARGTLGIGLAGGAGARTGLGRIAGARRGAADGARVAGGMRAGRSAEGAVAHVGGAGVAVVGARRAVRLERAIGRTARAGCAVRCAIVALLRAVDHAVATRDVADGDPHRIHVRRLAISAVDYGRDCRTEVGGID